MSMDICEVQFLSPSIKGDVKVSTGSKKLETRSSDDVIIKT